MLRFFFKLFTILKYRILFALNKVDRPLVRQAEYMGAAILVRANEDVGALILARLFEKDDLLYLLSKIKKTDIFFDIGANVGLFSIVISKKLPDIEIHAFEPIPLNVSLFKASLCLNDIDSVIVNQCCVGDFKGEVDFSLSVDSAYSSIHSTGMRKELKVISSDITTIDSYAKEKNIQRIDIMKIDVEGAENLVINGSASVFSNPSLRPRLILMELYDDHFKKFDTSIKKVVSLLGQYGYKPFIFENKIKTKFIDRHHNRMCNVFFEL